MKTILTSESKFAEKMLFYTHIIIVFFTLKTKQNEKNSVAINCLGLYHLYQVFSSVCYLFSQLSRAGTVSWKGHKLLAFNLEPEQTFLLTKLTHTMKNVSHGKSRQLYIKPNYFKKQSSSSSFLLTKMAMEYSTG